MSGISQWIIRSLVVFNLCFLGVVLGVIYGQARATGKQDQPDTTVPQTV